MSELKPCPFCGSESTKVMYKEKRHTTYTRIESGVFKEKNIYTMTASVRCLKCHARGGTASAKGAFASGYSAGLEERAIENWNRRE